MKLEWQQASCHVKIQCKCHWYRVQLFVENRSIAWLTDWQRQMRLFSLTIPLSIYPSYSVEVPVGLLESSTFYEELFSSDRLVSSLIWRLGVVSCVGQSGKLETSILISVLPHVLSLLLWPTLINVARLGVTYIYVHETQSVTFHFCRQDQSAHELKFTRSLCKDSCLVTVVALGVVTVGLPVQ